MHEKQPAARFENLFSTHGTISIYLQIVYLNITSAHPHVAIARSIFTVVSLVLLWYVVRNTFPVMILRDSLNKEKRLLVCFCLPICRSFFINIPLD